MADQTILLLVLVGILSALAAFYQYFFKNTTYSSVRFFLAGIRFLVFFGVGVLLINPKVVRTFFEEEKPPLAFYIDNSLSVSEFQAAATADSLYNVIKDHPEIRERFELYSFGFDSRVFPIEDEKSGLDFKGAHTRIDKVAANNQSVFRNKNFPTVIITDGNQTQGADYPFLFGRQAVFPVVLGDTTPVFDLKIHQLNVNRYAFLNNRFPVEAFLQYNGSRPVTAQFTITQGAKTLIREELRFTPEQRSQRLELLLPANQAGIQRYKASITSEAGEKNLYNNHKNFAVEVIDQRTEVAIVSTINHPDIGALKRSVENNRQRKVTVLKPRQLTSLNEYDVIIVYQPGHEFRSLLEASEKTQKNIWFITGMHTDFSLLNQYQDAIEFKMTSQKEEYLCDYNSLFNLFGVSDPGFDRFPPLQHPFGNVVPQGNVISLLNSRIRNVSLDQPLLAFREEADRRMAFLLGENSWKWRLQSYRGEQQFDEYDRFIDKIIQFLATQERKKNLVVTHENFYQSGDAIVISAQFFDKNYEFDPNARLSIQLTHEETREVKAYDLLKSGNSYQVSLDGIPSGNYSFIVKELNSNTSYNGIMEVLDFDIEKQFVNPDLNKLRELASQTGGVVVMPGDLDLLIRQLITDESYPVIQKKRTLVTPLIEWYWLLVILASLLATEWFARKYHGLL